MGNQPKMQGIVRKAFVGLVAAGAFVAVATPASAGCTTAYLCTWDQDRDGVADLLYAGNGAASTTVTATETFQRVATSGGGTSTQTTAWYVDEDGDGDPERLYVGSTATTSLAGQRGGGYATVYVVDRDRGDLVDYVSATAAGGLGGFGVGGGFQYADYEADLTPSTPYSSMSSTG